ncbi:MAG TPA: S53 family peptidase [Bryobacteraceae bacterium]|nr:S53 family peptidase [Bryobacteraceae bacterium]
MPGSRVVGSVDPNEIVSVSVILRRDVVTGGDNSSAMTAMEQFAHEYELTVADVNMKKRRVQMLGTVAALSKAFETEMQCYQIDTVGPKFRGRTGTISMPEEFKPYVLAVLGLDSRPVAKPHFRFNKRKHQPAAPPSTFTPPQVAQLYSYPSGADGTGQTIAIIELGGGYRTSDLKTYFSSLGIKQPAISAVSVDGGKNAPGGSADGEVMLDIEVAGAIAPGASYAVYFAPNTDQGFVDAITDAVHDTMRKPSVISISWGGPEDSWTAQAQNAMNAALQDAATLGVTVTVAAGDNGSSDGVGDSQLHVDFPAASPFALACGGTKLVGSGSNISSETVWNEVANKEGATGGGVSKVFAIPSYQSSANVPANPQTNFAGRGVPDVAGNADPATGYQIRYDGQNAVVGGTSAVAPQWAALVAILNQKLGKPVGFLNPALYSLPKGVLNDITSGNNDDSNLGHYSAGSGWDACTGLGSANGTALLNALQSSSTTSSGR